MEVILTDNGVFHRSQFESEAALEKAIVNIQTELFGKNRMYLDVKKKIGVKGGLRNIPDGYLLDLSDNKPRLYVVENELAAHDPLPIWRGSLGASILHLFRWPKILSF